MGCTVSEEIKQNWWYSTNADAATIVATITDTSRQSEIKIEQEKESEQKMEKTKEAKIRRSFYQKIVLDGSWFDRLVDAALFSSHFGSCILNAHINV